MWYWGTKSHCSTHLSWAAVTDNLQHKPYLTTPLWTQHLRERVLVTYRAHMKNKPHALYSVKRPSKLSFFKGVMWWLNVLNTTMWAKNFLYTGHPVVSSWKDLFLVLWNSIMSWTENLPVKFRWIILRKNYCNLGNYEFNNPKEHMVESLLLAITNVQCTVQSNRRH